MYHTTENNDKNMTRVHKEGVREVIVVLGNSNDSILTKRIDRAVREFKSSRCEMYTNVGLFSTKMILFSGVEAHTASNICERVFNINKKFFIKEDKSATTYQNIIFTLDLLNKLYPHSKPEITICTSSFHINRAMLLCQFILVPNGYNVRYIHTEESIPMNLYIKEMNSLIYTIDNFISPQYVLPGLTYTNPSYP